MEKTVDLRWRRQLWESLLLLAVALVLSFVVVGSVGAKAPGATLAYDALMTRLQAASGGELDGYFLTVLQGSTIEKISAKIIGYTPTGGWRDSLIFFRATDARVSAAGGIAAGMSGSPLYLDSGELIGAVAYGDALTPSGHGLATPIEAMEYIEDTRALSTPLGLQRSVLVGSKVVDKVLITEHPEEHRAEAATGTFLARPLSRLLIGGIKPTTAGARRIKALLDKHGITHQFLAVGDSASSDGKPPLQLPFIAGSSVGTLDVVGSIWGGSIGTVTYVNGQNALLYGHTIGNNGQVDGYMTNAWITGIFPTQLEPYKMGSPTAIVGLTMWDGTDGVLGKLDMTSPETKITATATDESSGRTEHSESFIHESLLSTNSWYSQLGIRYVLAALENASDRLSDNSYLSGTATTVSTVVVQGADKTHTIELKNVWSADALNDITLADVADILDRLLSVNQWGIEKLRVKSVDLQVNYTPKKTQSSIVSVEAPHGLKVGKNSVRAKLFTYGVKEPSYVEATLVIPKGFKISPDLVLSARAAADYRYDDEGGSADSEEYYEDYAAIIRTSNTGGLQAADSADKPYERDSIDEIVKDLKEQKPHENCRVIFSLRGADGVEEADGWAASKVSGTARGALCRITAKLSKKRLSYNTGLRITGTVSGPSESTVLVYGSPAAGSGEKLLAKKHISSDDELNKALSGTKKEKDESSLLFYSLRVPRLRQNMKLRVEAVGTTRYMTATTVGLAVKVRAKVALKLSARTVGRGKAVKLTAALRATGLKGSRVVFERQVGKKWVKVKAVKLRGRFASLSWKAPSSSGTYRLRVRFAGSKYNYQAVSAVKGLRVR